MLTCGLRRGSRRHEGRRTCMTKVIHAAREHETKHRGRSWGGGDAKFRGDGDGPTRGAWRQRLLVAATRLFRRGVRERSEDRGGHRTTAEVRGAWVAPRVARWQRRPAAEAFKKERRWGGRVWSQAWAGRRNAKIPFCLPAVSLPVSFSVSLSLSLCLPPSLPVPRLHVPGGGYCTPPGVLRTGLSR